MPDKHRRKTPDQPENRRPKQRSEPPSVPAADWLPREDADVAAWGRAAERAALEYDVAWQNYRLRRNDEKLCSAVENARLLKWYTSGRAFPAILWESKGDIQSGTTDHLETLLSFLEADLYFYGSGYAKSEIIRRLKRLALTPAQQNRLQNVVLRVIDKGFRREFRDYCRLARHVQSPEWLRQVETRLTSSDPNHALRAQWVLDACLQKEGRRSE